MNDYVCGNRALYICKPHQEAVCEKHKAIHEEGKERDHIYEILGQKLTAQRLTNIIECLSLKIKIVDQCANKIIEEFNRLVETITNSCMRALDVIKIKTKLRKSPEDLSQKNI